MMQMATRTDRKLPGGWAGWLLGRLNGGDRPRPRLALLERIALAPRQSLALVEADGRRFLVATCADGGPVFYALDDGAESAGGRRTACMTRTGASGLEKTPRSVSGRISW